jgi:alpha-N-arabinofuranosidase
MANLAQSINVLQAVILTNEEKMILTPTYHVLEMYNVHQDATLLPLELQTVDYTFGSEKLPAISASASKDKNGVIHISLVNIDPKKAQDITLTLDGKATAVTGRILASATMTDHNTFENPEKIKPVVFKGAQLKGNKLQVKLPACSVVVLELK